MHAIDHRKLLATPSIHNCWLVNTCLGAGWANWVVQVHWVGTCIQVFEIGWPNLHWAIVFRGESFNNGITSCGPTGPLISVNPGWYHRPLDMVNASCKQKISHDPLLDLLISMTVDSQTLEYFLHRLLFDICFRILLEFSQIHFVIHREHVRLTPAFRENSWNLSAYLLCSL